MENNKMVKMSKILDVLTNIFQKVSIVLCGVCVIALILMGTKKDWIPARILDVDIGDLSLELAGKESIVGDFPTKYWILVGIVAIGFFNSHMLRTTDNSQYIKTYETGASL